MVDDGFILVVEGDERFTPEELDEASRQLREELLAVDDVEVSGVPDDTVGDDARSLLTDIPATIFVLILAGRMAMPMLRSLARGVNEASKHVKEASTEIKEAGEHLAEARANFSDAASLVAPKLAERIRNWTQRHPGKRLTARFPGHEPIDLTPLSTDQAAVALVDGMAPADAVPDESPRSS